MKAEQRKEIETNSLVLAVQRIRKHATGRGAYYALGTIALIIAGVLLYRYFAGETRKTRDAVLKELVFADTPEKLKTGMEEHRGSVYGSLFKINLARHLLLNEGLPRLGTDHTDARKQAAASVEQARTYYLELTSELKEKDEPALVQEAWGNAGQAEESLVGLPTAEGSLDYRGNVDKAIEYYDKAAAIFPDTDFSKKYKARADKLRANKDQFVADQKAIYKLDDSSPFRFPPAPGKTDPFGPLGPILPPLPSSPKGDVPSIPPAPTIPDPIVPADPKKSPDNKTTTPVIPPPTIPNPKVPADPKKSPDLKPPELPKPADPKGK